MSTTNDLVIRMGCGNGDTVGRKWGNGKGLREGSGSKNLEVAEALRTADSGKRRIGGCERHPPPLHETEPQGLATQGVLADRGSASRHP